MLHIGQEPVKRFLQASNVLILCRPTTLQSRSAGRLKIARHAEGHDAKRRGDQVPGNNKKRKFLAAAGVRVAKRSAFNRRGSSAVRLKPDSSRLERYPALKCRAIFIRPWRDWLDVAFAGLCSFQPSTVESYNRVGANCLA